ncbi:MAG: dUTP diphosphatase [Eubacteriales bacterium]|jgi:dUTP pyrophosphatase
MGCNSIKINAIPLQHCVSLPKYAHEDGGDAAADAFAAVIEPVDILPGETCIIPLGFKIKVPDGFMLAVLGRSGLAAKGIQVPNSPGVVDGNYRGEVCALLYNSLRDKAFTVSRGDRICQVALIPVFNIRWNIVKELPETSRGAGGFGSTGVDIE